jgi:hypothetical protein
MAFPPPSFKWYRVHNGPNISEAHRGVIGNASISTNAMHTNFTLENVHETDYGEYLLKIENQYGSFQQIFFILAKGIIR